MDALRSVATAPWLQSLALLCLCAAYLQGGWHRARDFRGVVAEVKALGLPPAAPIAAAALVLQLAASALLTDRFRAAPQVERQHAVNAFFEHWGLVGGMLLVAWHDLGDSHAG